MSDELNLELRKLVERAVRDETPAHPALKRRVQRAVALAAPAGAAFGTGLAAGVADAATTTLAAKGAVATLGTAGTAAATTPLVATGAAATLGTATTCATLAGAAASHVGVGLLHGFLGWVAGGFLLGISATGAYVAWTDGGTLEGTGPKTDSNARSVAVPHVAASGAAAVVSPRGNPTPDADPNTREATPEAVPAPVQSGAARSAKAANDPGQVPSLAEEVSQLARVQRQLREQQGQAALETIEEAARRFPQSQLQPDLQAARVLALCQLGQLERARQAAESFLRGHVASPLTQRVQSSCAFAPPGQPAASKLEH